MEKNFKPPLTVTSIIGFRKCLPFGSSHTCVPAPEGSDYDWLVLVDSEYRAAESLQDIGFSSDLELRDSDYEDVDFISMRKGDVDIILTHNPQHYEKNRIATDVVRKLNVQNKAERVMIYDAIVRGKGPNDL